MAGFFEQIRDLRAERRTAQAARAAEVVEWYRTEKARIVADPSLGEIPRETALLKLNREFMKRSRASRRG